MTTAIGVLAAVVVIATFGLGVNAGHVPSHPTITVVFTPDDMGFEATSSKDISNVIVEFCDLSNHKHDDLNGTVFNHTETQLITGVWVKSGNNGIEGNDPPGAGERFDNAGVNCGATTTTTPPTTTTTPPTNTTTPPTNTTTPPTNTTAPPTTEIPFFPSGTALVLASIGAIGGTFLVLRRRN